MISNFAQLGASHWKVLKRALNWVLRILGYSVQYFHPSENHFISKALSGPPQLPQPKYCGRVDPGSLAAPCRRPGTSRWSWLGCLWLRRSQPRSWCLNRVWLWAGSSVKSAFYWGGGGGRWPLSRWLKWGANLTRHFGEPVSLPIPECLIQYISGHVSVLQVWANVKHLCIFLGRTEGSSS